MTVSSRRRTYALLLAAALTLAAVLTIAGSSHDANAAPKPRSSASDLLLRLHDLGPGYFFLTFSEGNPVPKLTCDRLQPADPEPMLAKFIASYSPHGCLTLYARAYRVPEHRPARQLIGTAALDARSTAAAEAGLAVAPELLMHLGIDEHPKEVTPPAAVGDATRLFHWKRFPIISTSASLLAWRSGDVLGAVFVQGGSTALDDSEALAAARLQQEHIEHPTPYTAAERYDREVGLDDPGIEVPVFWLGRTFRPGHGLPTARLEGGSTASRPPNGLPGQKLGIDYTKGIDLSSWTAAGWRRFLATPISRPMRTWHCTESTPLDLPHGSAAIYAAYNRDYAVCPAAPPTRYFAFARIGGTVTAVDFVDCRNCTAPRGGPFNSAAGMETIVRTLHLRPARSF